MKKFISVLCFSLVAAFSSQNALAQRASDMPEGWRDMIEHIAERSMKLSSRRELTNHKYFLKVYGDNVEALELEPASAFRIEAAEKEGQLNVFKVTIIDSDKLVNLEKDFTTPVSIKYEIIYSARSEYHSTVGRAETKCVVNLSFLSSDSTVIDFSNYRGPDYKASIAYDSKILRLINETGTVLQFERLKSGPTAVKVSLSKKEKDGEYLEIYQATETDIQECKSSQNPVLYNKPQSNTSSVIVENGKSDTSVDPRKIESAVQETQPVKDLACEVKLGTNPKSGLLSDSKGQFPCNAITIDVKKFKTSKTRNGRVKINYKVKLHLEPVGEAYHCLMVSFFEDLESGEVSYETKGGSNRGSFHKSEYAYIEARDHKSKTFKLKGFKKSEKKNFKKLPTHNIRCYFGEI